MPPQAEKTETVPAAPAHTAMFSPVGIVVVLLLLVIEGVGVFMIAKYLGGSKGGADASPDERFRTVKLDQVSLEIPVGDDATRLTETFMVQPVLVLNPNFDNMDDLKTQVEMKKDLLMDRVNSIISRAMSAT